MMAMYVDLYDSRNYYIGEDGEYQKWNIDPKTIEETADVVEVVRCKDCKYFYDNSCDSLELYYCTIDPYYQPETGKYDFCSYGEREK